MPIIEIENFTKTYPLPDNKNETFRAVDGVSLLIETGEVFGILGPNGAGKTTTLEMLEGLNDIDGGHATIDGIDVQSYPFKIKEIIGVQLQASEYFDNFQRGCFAGAIGTKNAKYLARFDEQGDAVNGAKGFVFVVGKWVGLREILDFDDWHKILCLNFLF
jgi:ABC-type Na+ transport system ATPase subunit NatA